MYYKSRDPLDGMKRRPRVVIESLGCSLMKFCPLMYAARMGVAYLVESLFLFCLLKLGFEGIEGEVYGLFKRVCHL